MQRRDRSAAGHGGMTLLDGASGVGKSTIVSLLAQQTPAPPFLVVLAKASWTEDPAPFQLVGDALKSLAAGNTVSGGPEPDPLDSAPLAFQPAVERARSRFSVMDPLGSMDEGAASELASDRLRLLGSLAEPILAAAQKGPVLILLDDLHRADEASRAFLLYLLPRIATLPIWVLATCDPARANAHPGSDPLVGIRARGEVERVTLPPLTEPEVAEFVQWTVPGEPLPASEIHRLHVKSGGVPFRVVQLLAPSASTPAEEAAAASASDSVAGTGAEREAESVLNLALVAGPEVHVKRVAAAAGLSEEATSRYLSQLATKGVLHAVGGGRFAFDREETRDSMIARLPARTVQLSHRKLAEALLRDGPAGVDLVYAVARHAYLGGLDREAVEYNQRAASIAAES
ncbi:MAG: ATP-binding protein, partial [Thermoplasmata archaeon]|nr:ATP-binding protein [Thermoplasmata archaeon]